MTEQPIYKIVTTSEWQVAKASGVFKGAPVDLADGFIHFSTVDQVVETAVRHFSGKTDLVLVTVDPAALGDGLKYEPSRDGALFPHLYGDLPLDAVLEEQPLPLAANGRHDFRGLVG